MKKWIAVLLAGVMILSLAACSGEEEFDAKGYVQGVLDAYYHGECADHAEDTGETEEEVAQQIRDTNVETAKSALAATGIEATDEEVETYVDLIETGYQKITYEVQDAVKDEDGNFTVDVIITPVGILDHLEEIFTARLEAAIAEGVDASGYMAVFNEAVKESIAQAEIYEPQTVTLNVTYTEEDGSRVYAVSDSEIQSLDQIATHVSE